MSRVQLTDIDLNLLVVLDVLLEELHVTRSAKRLRRTQSATSQALARLRDQLDDPLLVKVGGQMRPTPKAMQLAPELHRLLEELEEVLNPSGKWDPSTSQRTFTVCAPDFLSAAFPALIRAMAADAPGARADFVPARPSMFREVATGIHDAAVFRAMTTDAEVTCQPVCSLEHVVFSRRGHPALADWGLSAWLQHPHIRIRVVGGDSPVDRYLAARGLSRRAGPAFANFLMVPPVLADSDMLFTAPYGILAHAAERFQLVANPCPIPIDNLTLAVYVGHQYTSDPAVTWFRNALRQAVAETFDRRAPGPCQTRAATAAPGPADIS